MTGSGPFGRFFLPGPTEVRPEILAAQLRPMIGHRGAAMQDLIARIEDGAKYLFRTARPVYIASSSGTGFMEAALRDGARSRVLSLVNGAFSERFHRIALACGYHAESLVVPAGDVHTPEMLGEALRAGSFDAVTVVHSETSTGALQPIADLARVAHQAGDVALLVDSVSGVGGAPLLADEWDLDFVLTASQKALALPPGLALGVAQPALLERARRHAQRGLYFDFLDFEKFIRLNEPPHTPAVSLLYALDAQLAAIRAEGIEARWERHAEMARRCWAWVGAVREQGSGVEIVAREGWRSPTVTCLRLPEGRSGPEVQAAMQALGFTIGTGSGPLRETTVRVGHMGDHTVAELDLLLDALAGVLAG